MFIFTRRFIVVFFSISLILFTLIYTDHTSIRAIKRIGVVSGIVDSEYQIVGVNDVTSKDHKRGNIDSLVVLVEYSDFTCSLCSVIQSVFNRLVKEQNVLVVSRYLHTGEDTEGFKRAVAAECVAELLDEDSYFKFANYLYENQHVIDSDDELLTEAIKLGADTKDFKRCISDSKHIKDRINSQTEEGWQLGARGTPYIVVIYNGKPVGISYANHYPEFLERIKALITNR